MTQPADQPQEKSLVRTCAACGVEKPLVDTHFRLTKSGQHFRRKCRPCETKRNPIGRNKTADEARKLRDEGGLALQPLPTRSDASKDPVVAATRAAILEARAQITDATRTILHPARLPAAELSVAGGMRIAGSKINELARPALETLAAHVQNVESKHHEWAMRLVLERLMPQRLYTNMGLRDAGFKGDGGEDGESPRRPQIHINILPAGGDAPRGRVLEVQPDDRSDT